MYKAVCTYSFRLDFSILDCSHFSSLFWDAGELFGAVVSDGIADEEGQASQWTTTRGEGPSRVVPRRAGVILFWHPARARYFLFL